MRVRFTQDTIFETEGFRKGPRFEAGSAHDFADDFAQKWINRGVAERVEDEPVRPRRAPPPPAPPPPTADTAPPPPPA